MANEASTSHRPTPAPGRWQTLTAARVVLAVARTYTSAVRLVDALSVFRGDDRVQILFAIDDSSAFSGGVHEFLSGAGARLILWEEARDLECDAVITASENIDLSRVKAPVLVLPHGIGFHKMVPDAHFGGERVSGLVPARFRRGRKVWMAISHPKQREQLRLLDPPAADDCVVLGDSTYDRLTASLPLREHFRHLLGVEPHQRLVLMSSTWRADSLLGRRPGLPARVMRGLPMDEYRVALVTHPNVVSWHGAFHLRQVLADADEMGLVRIPPACGWQAALIAADCVIGDHGSVTLYGAAIDRPVLLSGGSDEVVEDTPPDRLRTLVPALRDDRPIEEQVIETIDDHRAGRLRELTGQMFALQGQAVAELRRFVYDLLELPEPDYPAPVRAVADPMSDRADPRSFIVYSRGDAEAGVRVWRYPTRGRRREAGKPDLYRHLACYEDEADRLLVSNASVVARRRVTDEADARAWIRRTMAHYPGALMAIAATGEGYLGGMRDGRVTLASHGGGSPGDPVLAATAVYTCRRSGRIPDGPVALWAGGCERTLLLADVTADSR